MKLRCYHCNGAVLDGTNNKNDKCSNDRACGQKQTVIFAIIDFHYLLEENFSGFACLEEFKNI